MRERRGGRGEGWWVWVREVRHDEVSDYSGGEEGGEGFEGLEGGFFDCLVLL